MKLEKIVYNPKCKLGDKVYYISYDGKEIKRAEIIEIVFTQTITNNRRSSYYKYCTDDEWCIYEEDINKCYFLTEQEAEKARLEYLEKRKKEKVEEIIENYKKAKKEYDELINNIKIN